MLDRTSRFGCPNPDQASLSFNTGGVIRTTPPPARRRANFPPPALPAKLVLTCLPAARGWCSSLAVVRFQCSCRHGTVSITVFYHFSVIVAFAQFHRSNRGVPFRRVPAL